ncbi:Crp/Fnr family transcriptional regulator [Streptomyces sp. XM4011]|uniref:Crp/Fnr family transcriptional regulator n=1 Tax=Streptomyces sp. XM4011 TaxID=2929780 RepID=UPI001FFB2E84|nr:Crp/Fnr family transcriptional regulator [Streptomyces sp. XM4011]MCK1814621.1 Crp/Fnr family transcriptional regulator [Streptomyces sp. XM4011]
MRSDQMAEILARQGTQRLYAAGDVMLSQGSRGTYLLVLTTGLAKVVQHRRDGTVLWLAFRGPGELLGEVSVLSRGHQLRGADVVAVTPCVTRVLHARWFRQFIEENDLHADLLDRAMEKTRESNEYRAELITLPVRARLARTLQRLSILAGSRQLTGLTQEELAQAVGASRNSVTEALQDLREVGAVATARKVISVVDTRVLDEWADRP